MSDSGPTSPLQRIIAALAARGSEPRQRGRGWRAKCPAHRDVHPSLDIDEGQDGRVLLKCRSAGCSAEAICHELGLTTKDLFLAAVGSGSLRIVATYDYKDAAGNLLYQVVREVPKNFKIRTPDAGRGWVWKFNGTRVLYKLARLLKSHVDDWVFFCEGEKDADNGERLGVLTVTTMGGAENWKHTPVDALKDRRVCLLPHNDDAGRKMMNGLALKLVGAAAEVRILELPGLTTRGADFSDWINKGGTREELLRLVDSAPPFQPADTSVGFGSSLPGRSPSDWPDPQPLPDELPPVAPFDVSLLPIPLQDWVRDVAQRAQCPPDFTAVGAMIALAALIGRKVGIRPKRKDNWTVVVNLWGGVIGRPGLLKTPMLEEATRPLKRLEIAAKKRLAQENLDFAAKVLVRDAQQKEMQKSIRDAVKNNEDAESVARDLLRQQALESAPVRKRYLVNDATVEKLGEILNENPNGVLYFRDELAGFFRSLEREGHECDRAFYLEAWNGSGRFTYDRIGRGTIDIESAIVSILGGIQPAVLQVFIRSTLRQVGNDGLIQRFQLLVWPDVSKAWRNVDQWPNTEAKNRAYAVFESMDFVDPGLVNATVDEADPEIPFLRFDEAGQTIFDSWREELEVRLRSGDLHPMVEDHLAKYRSLLPALALIIHLAEGQSGSVGVAPVQKAIGWARYLETHAHRVYYGASHPDVAAAKALERKLLKRELKDGFALRDVYRHGWAGLTDRDEVERGVDLLCDCDWLTATKEPTGGAPRTRFWINPKIYESPPGPTDKTAKSPSIGLLSVLAVPSRGHFPNSNASEDRQPEPRSSQSDDRIIFGEPDIEAPPGWTEAGWISNLERLASCCESTDPELAREHRAHAAAMRVKKNGKAHPMCPVPCGVDEAIDWRIIDAT